MMKATGIVRKVDELGRIVIPIELRRTMDMPEGTPLEVFVDSDRIVLQKYAPGCVFCGEVNNLRDFRGKLVCRKCAGEMGRHA